MRRHCCGYCWCDDDDDDGGGGDDDDDDDDDGGGGVVVGGGGGADDDDNDNQHHRHHHHDHQTPSMFLPQPLQTDILDMAVAVCRCEFNPSIITNFVLCVI
jgi:hypothetical protein